MRTLDKPPFIIPPCSRGLFPHRDFPPWIALARVFDLIGEATRRPRVPSELERLQEPLVDASERIVEAASGELPVHRWHRRLAVSAKLCMQAQDSLASYATLGVLTSEQAIAISDAIDGVVRALIAVWEGIRLPDEVRAALPPLLIYETRSLQ